METENKDKNQEQDARWCLGADLGSDPKSWPVSRASILSIDDRRKRTDEHYNPANLIYMRALMRLDSTVVSRGESYLLHADGYRYASMERRRVGSGFASEGFVDFSSLDGQTLGLGKTLRLSTALFGYKNIHNMVQNSDNEILYRACDGSTEAGPLSPFPEVKIPVNKYNICTSDLSTWLPPVYGNRFYFNTDVPTSKLRGVGEIVDVMYFSFNYAISAMRERTISSPSRISVSELKVVKVHTPAAGVGRSASSVIESIVNTEESDGGVDWKAWGVHGNGLHNMCGCDAAAIFEHSRDGFKNMAYNGSPFYLTLLSIGDGSKPNVMLRGRGACMQDMVVTEKTFCVEYTPFSNNLPHSDIVRQMRQMMGALVKDEALSRARASTGGGEAAEGGSTSDKEKRIIELLSEDGGGKVDVLVKMVTGTSMSEEGNIIDSFMSFQIMLEDSRSGEMIVSRAYTGVSLSKSALLRVSSVRGYTQSGSAIFLYDGDDLNSFIDLALNAATAKDLVKEAFMHVSPYGSRNSMVVNRSSRNRLRCAMDGGGRTNRTGDVDIYKCAMFMFFSCMLMDDGQSFWLTNQLEVGHIAVEPNTGALGTNFATYFSELNNDALRWNVDLRAAGVRHISKALRASKKQEGNVKILSFQCCPVMSYISFRKSSTGSWTTGVLFYGTLKDKVAAICVTGEDTYETIYSGRGSEKMKLKIYKMIKERDFICHMSFLNCSAVTRTEFGKKNYKPVEMNMSEYMGLLEKVSVVTRSLVMHESSRKSAPIGLRMQVNSKIVEMNKQAASGAIKMSIPKSLKDVVAAYNQNLLVSVRSPATFEQFSNYIDEGALSSFTDQSNVAWLFDGMFCGAMGLLPINSRNIKIAGPSGNAVVDSSASRIKRVGPMSTRSGLSSRQSLIDYGLSSVFVYGGETIVCDKAYEKLIRSVAERMKRSTDLNTIEEQQADSVAEPILLHVLEAAVRSTCEGIFMPLILRDIALNLNKASEEGAELTKEVEFADNNGQWILVHLCNKSGHRVITIKTKIT